MYAIYSSFSVVSYDIITYLYTIVDSFKSVWNVASERKNPTAKEGYQCYDPRYTKFVKFSYSSSLVEAQFLAVYNFG